MLIFLDCEWSDGIDCDLVSIGMVSESGHATFYAERTDVEYALNEFVRVAVCPHLGADPAATASRDELRLRLDTWFKTLPPSITIAADSYTDWELLLDALGDERPANLTGYYDTRPLGTSAVFNQAMCAYHAAGHPWHHALHDAIGHRMGWLAWIATEAGTTSQR